MQQTTSPPPPDLGRVLLAWLCQPGDAPQGSGLAAELRTALDSLSWSEALELAQTWPRWCHVRVGEEALRLSLEQVRGDLRGRDLLRELRDLGAPYDLLRRLFGISRRTFQDMGAGRAASAGAVLGIGKEGRGRPRELRCDERERVLRALHRLRVPAGALPRDAGEWLGLARLTQPVPLRVSYAWLLRGEAVR